LRRIFAESPRSFCRRVGALFDGWRRSLASLPMLWLTPASAERVRRLLRLKQRADGNERRRIRRELRDLGVGPARLGELLPGAGLDAAGFDELIERGVIGVGHAPDLAAAPVVDRLRDSSLEAGPNEASGICPASSPKLLGARGWDRGFWVVLDDDAVERCVALVGHEPGLEGGWKARTLEASVEAPDRTDDGEDCVRIAGWVYLIGSHYGSKAGPLEGSRQFVARFREADAAEEPVPLEVARTGFRLHRLINDALAAADIELFELGTRARDELISATIDEGEDDQDDPRSERVRTGDLPINIEGAALRPNGGLLLGLRFPVSRQGNPLIIELDDFAALFAGRLPTVRGVWVVPGVGHPSVPAGIRGLGEGEDGCIEAITGDLDSSPEKSVLLASHPEGGRAFSAHFTLRLPGNRRGGRAEAGLVREFPGFERVEGVARDELGRCFYVVDEGERLRLLYSEPFDRIATR
jgi:hypothetical protein